MTSTLQPAMESLSSSFMSFAGSASLTNSTEDFFATSRNVEETTQVLDKLAQTGGLIDLDNFLKDNLDQTSNNNNSNRSGLIMSGNIKQEPLSSSSSYLWDVEENTANKLPSGFNLRQSCDTVLISSETVNNALVQQPQQPTTPPPVRTPSLSRIPAPISAIISAPRSSPEFSVLSVGEKVVNMISLDQLIAMIESGNPINMNAYVAMNFTHEGKPFGLKVSILLQLLLHQAAYAFWMGKKSAPTASRNCRFEGSRKGQTKYPKRKFCGWVNKVAEVAKPYNVEALCIALQELWSLLRLSPQEMDCKQVDNVKRVLREFFRVHSMLLSIGTQHTITQLWTNVLTTAARPEIFMKKDDDGKRKKKSSKASSDDEGEETLGAVTVSTNPYQVQIKGEQSFEPSAKRQKTTASSNLNRAVVAPFSTTGVPTVVSNYGNASNSRKRPASNSNLPTVASAH
eukprot:TRINITY_DN7530_c0_g2_i1.p1 TRINITY_DN7530_c0_g2~~TRINITY_DN7530_c0_g2_i1.p1  ORF type:complete len:456 (-),score=111.84 TRINITY_DN7530_c0_g2_i1:266-1633(-)